MKEELDDLESEESFAKQQLKSKESGTKLLGLGWNESEDTISISFEKKDSEPTKRGVLQPLASIYDPLGIVSPVTLMGIIIFRDICDQHLKWDSELPENLRERWRRFVKNLPGKIEVLCSISKEGGYRELICMLLVMPVAMEYQQQFTPQLPKIQGLVKDS